MIGIGGWLAGHRRSQQRVIGGYAQGTAAVDVDEVGDGPSRSGTRAVGSVAHGPLITLGMHHLEGHRLSRMWNMGDASRQVSTCRCCPLISLSSPPCSALALAKELGPEGPHATLAGAGSESTPPGTMASGLGGHSALRQAQARLDAVVAAMQRLKQLHGQAAGQLACGQGSSGSAMQQLASRMPPLFAGSQVSCPCRDCAQSWAQKCAWQFILFQQVSAGCVDPTHSQQPSSAAESDWQCYDTHHHVLYARPAHVCRPPTGEASWCMSCCRRARC